MSRRTQRLGETFKEVLGDLIHRQVKDPRIGFITITSVRVTPDLAKAFVYYTVLGDDVQREQTQAGLLSASSFLRSEVAHQMRLRTMPQLEFAHDDSIEHGQRVDQLLAEIRGTTSQAKEPAPDDAGGADAPGGSG